MSVARIKYMGSKRAMLRNGLGLLLDRELSGVRKFYDLFTGSGSVATHIAQNYRIAVRAYDLQSYSVVLTGCIIERTKPVNPTKIWDSWYARALGSVVSIRVPRIVRFSMGAVYSQREWCARQRHLPITEAYGGHYFSAEQAVWLDAFRASLPARGFGRQVALAALLHAASQCVAAPGHTAQPFQPTAGALPFLKEYWQRNVICRTRMSLENLGQFHALVAGSSSQANANCVAKKLGEGDLAFIDPPYSGVHYSRFYHVLETIAQGRCGDVTGVGRYPDSDLRPRSRYSLKTESASALEKLLSTISARGAKAVLTFPDHECSNGLAGTDVREISSKYFKVEELVVSTKFSTLGGRGESRRSGRAARDQAQELMLVLRPG